MLSQPGSCVNDNIWRPMRIALSLERATAKFHFASFLLQRLRMLRSHFRPIVLTSCTLKFSTFALTFIKCQSQQVCLLTKSKSNYRFEEIPVNWKRTVLLSFILNCVCVNLSFLQFFLPHYIWVLSHWAIVSDSESKVFLIFFSHWLVSSVIK